MRKTDEAERPHRQRQVVVVESRWHSGELRCLGLSVVLRTLKIR